MLVLSIAFYACFKLQHKICCISSAALSGLHSKKGTQPSFLRFNSPILALTSVEYSHSCIQWMNLTVHGTKVAFFLLVWGAGFTACAPCLSYSGFLLPMLAKKATHNRQEKQISHQKTVRTDWILTVPAAHMLSNMWVGLRNARRSEWHSHVVGRRPLCASSAEAKKPSWPLPWSLRSRSVCPRSFWVVIWSFDFKEAFECVSSHAQARLRCNYA